MNGIEFLKVIKEDTRLKRIPVIVLTTSNEERDVVESFKLSDTAERLAIDQISR